VGDLLKYTLWSNTLLRYLTALLIFIGGVFIIKIFRHVILKRLERWAKKTATTLDDLFIELIQRIGLPLAYFGIFYLSSGILTLNKALRKVIDVLGIALITLFIARLLVALIEYILRIYWSKRGENVTLKRSLSGILRVIKILIWGMAIVFLLDNLGFKISTVIAGLGIGGVAVGLAAQAILKDLFSYFSIIFDRPFEIGDFIIIGDYLGTVEYIGAKTTRIRSLSGEQLIFSNTDLTDSRVRNYKRMNKRRVLFRLGVTYDTNLLQLKEIPEIIKTIVTHIDDTVFDRAHFVSYGDFSLIFEIVYYVVGSDYNKYMDIQQEINLDIKKEFQEHGIEFAFPTQTIYMAK